MGLLSKLVMAIFLCCSFVNTAQADLIEDLNKEHDKSMEMHDEWKKEHSEAKDVLKQAGPLLKWMSTYAREHQNHMKMQERRISQHEKMMTAHKKSKDPTVAKLRDKHNGLLKSHKEMEEAHEHLMDDFDDFASIIKKIADFKDEISEHKAKEKYKEFHK